MVCSWERGCVIISMYFISIHLQTKFKFMLLFLRYLWNPLKPSVLLVQFWPLSTPNCGCPYLRRLFFCPFDLFIGPVRQKGPVEDLSILISNLIQLGTLVRHCLMSWKDPKFYFYPINPNNNSLSCIINLPLGNFFHTCLHVALMEAFSEMSLSPLLALKLKVNCLVSKPYSTSWLSKVVE